jgi:DNA-binding CsgD family transcriptional regulator
MNLTTDSVTSLFDGGLALATISGEENPVIPIDVFSSVLIGSIYIIDFQKQCFRYISDHNLFLCGHSREEAMQSGYKFYSEIVHKSDFKLMIKMYRAILRYIDEYPETQENINYFSFTLRIKDSPSMYKPDYLMVYHKLKPVFFDTILRFGVCALTCSVVRNSGNLRVYLKNNRDFDEYSFRSEKWSRRQDEHLTEQELMILKLSKQRICNKEIAAKMRISYDRLRHINMQLFQKINVETMEQAVIYATNHSMLFASKPELSEQSKQSHNKLTTEKLHHIQICLNNEQKFAYRKNTNFLCGYSLSLNPSAIRCRRHEITRLFRFNLADEQQFQKKKLPFEKIVLLLIVKLMCFGLINNK